MYHEIMASKKQWDFKCPQYVDFRAGLDSNEEDSFFDCTDNFSPSVEKAWQNVPAPANNLIEEDENKLIDKMTAALSFLGNTPKIKKNSFIKTKEFRPKRRSSLGDLKVMKKHTYPKTPLCLKRTINAKNKKNLKTSEEKELEVIAGFQKKLAKLLRNNEISYNKMKRRQIKRD